MCSANRAPIDSLAAKVGEVLRAASPAFAFPLVFAYLARIASQLHACLFDEVLKKGAHDFTPVTLEMAASAVRPTVVPTDMREISCIASSSASRPVVRC